MAKTAIEAAFHREFDADIEWTPVGPNEHVKPYVHRGPDSVSMHFSLTEIQSRMRPSNPDALELEYTRLMMAFVRFEPQPRRIALIGLGGGSLAKFCHRNLPQAHAVAVEVNPHVVALRDEFGVPPDGDRFEVITQDGAAFVEESVDPVDALLVDAFDDQGMPEALGTQRFYDRCRRLLSPQGVFVVNLQASHPHCALHVERIRECFEGNLLRVEAKDGSNSVVFAGNGRGLWLRPVSALRRKAWASQPAWHALAADFARVARAASAQRSL
ncbi:MAG: Spermine synthase [Rhizobacter sp.]|nr:Spermine synthase [Rhizobacter sp.]